MMSLIPYDPFDEMQRMRVPMRRLRQLTTSPASMLQLADDLTRWSSWSPQFNMSLGDNLAVDMKETDNEVVITAAVPGVEPDQIVIEEKDGWLSIRVEQKHENQQNHKGWHLQERYYGAWRRTLRLPVGVNVDKANTGLDQGLLTITLPKGEEHRPLLQRIKVKLPKLKLPKVGKKEPEIKVLSGKGS